MKTIVLLFFSFLFLSFSITSNKGLEFVYPKKKEAAFTMNTDKFKKFTEEWRGADYYYLCNNGENGMICSVLFFKLNEDEQVMLVDGPQKTIRGTEVSPGYPLAYFTSHSNLKKMESNQSTWGKPTDEFMFSQSDIVEFSGVKIDQKHMYAFAMFGKDLFLNVHLSKTGCSPADSVVMRQIVEGLKKK